MGINTKVQTLCERGVGVIMVEQNIREALPVADSLYVLAGGKEQFSGTPDLPRAAPHVSMP